MSVLNKVLAGVVGYSVAGGLLAYTTVRNYYAFQSGTPEQQQSVVELQQAALNAGIVEKELVPKLVAVFCVVAWPLYPILKVKKFIQKSRA